MTRDPLTVAAFVDGELDDVTARRIAREAESDAGLAAAIARERALRARLATHYAPVLNETLPDRLTTLLANGLRVDDSLTARRAEKVAGPARSRNPELMQWGAMAACLAIGIFIGTGPWQTGASVSVERGSLVASGALANALDTQLASNQSPDSAVRIGTSFTDRAGRYCRTFDGAALAGIGCRDAGSWQLEQTVRGSPTSDYRQASASTLAAAAAVMMRGEPLDATTERAARDKGWRE